jgi:hypothetical protein
MGHARADTMGLRAAATNFASHAFKFFFFPNVLFISLFITSHKLAKLTTQIRKIEEIDHNLAF